MKPRYTVPITRREASAPEIPYGYCQCGCGEKTKLSKQNHTQHGWVAGVQWTTDQPGVYLRAVAGGFEGVMMIVHSAVEEKIA